MMRSKIFQRFLLTIFLGAFFLACQKQSPQDLFQMDLCVQNGAGKWLYLYEMKANTGEVCVDSILLDSQGNGKISFIVDTLSLFSLKAAEKENNQLILLPGKGEYLRLRTDYRQIAAFAQIDSLFSYLPKTQYTCCATQISINFQKKIHKNTVLNKEVSKYWISVQEGPRATQIHDSLAHFLDSVFLIQKEESICLASLYTNSLIPIYVAYQPFGDRLMFDLQDDSDLNILSSWADEMSSALPSNPHTLRFKSNMDHFKHILRVQNLEKDRMKEVYSPQKNKAHEKN